MTPEEIRAEAIARLRAALEPISSTYCCEECAPGQPYVEGNVDFDVLVDALGDLLPIGEESRYLGRGMDRRTRYVTAWREVTG